MSAQEGVAWGGGGSLQFEWYLCQHAQRGCRAGFRRHGGGGGGEREGVRGSEVGPVPLDVRNG
jgi:hypothetical protein